MKWQQRSLSGLTVFAALFAGLALPAIGQADVVIVESRFGGQNYSSYSEPLGAWSDITYKSTAGGCTAGIGSRYSTSGTPSFKVTPTLATAGGTYDVFVTLPSTSRLATDLVVQIIQTGCTGLPASTALLGQTTTVNSWALVGRVTLDPGVSSPSIEFKYSSGTIGFNRFYADAVRFEEVTSCTVSINSPPTGQTVPEGGTATFTVSATGAGTLSYEWTWKGQPIQPDPTDPSKLVIPNVQLGDSGSKVAVTVTDDNCSRTSDEATLTVQALPEIIQPPQDQYTVAGNSATFIVIANSNLPLTYEWHFQRVGQQDQIVGGNSPTWTLFSAQAIDNGAKVFVKVTDSIGGSVTSPVPPAVLTVTGLLRQPQNAYVAVGNTARFSAEAVGPAPLTYIWYVDDVPQPAPADPTMLIIENVQETQTAPVIRVAVTDGAQNTVWSNQVTYTVVPCNPPYADEDADTDVDQDDFGAFQACFTADGVGVAGLIGAGYCACFDREPAGGDGDIDGADLAAFEAYWSGPNVPFAAPALNITRQPQDANVAVGNNGIFKVSAVGSEPLSYAWTFDGVPLETNSSTLILPGVQATDSGKAVQVVVTDATTDSVASNLAYLTVVTCHSPFADFEPDGDVDQNDFAEFQLCFTGASGLPIPDGYCACFDQEPAGGDGDIDGADRDEFAKWITGPLSVEGF